MGRRVAEIRARAADGRMELVGESGRDPVVLSPASATWSSEFGPLRDRLAAALGPAVVRIDHVGSTAIAGIPAKPVIDVQISVADVTDEISYVAAIESLGWSLRAREPELGHVYFREPAGVPRRVHIHVCNAGGKWERDHLLFRDYLRAHPEHAAAYAALKAAAVDRYELDRVAYTEAKGPFIEAALVRAEQWAAETGWVA